MQVTEPRRISNYREDVLHTQARIPLIYIVERESTLGKLALGHLEQEGFGVRKLSMRADVIQRLEQLAPSLVIIETTMSKGRALELCREIRMVHSLTRTPLILLAVNASEEERILGLESGADDYITESSSGPEVIARVRAVIRRFARQELRSGIPHLSIPFLDSLAETASPAITLGDIEIDLNAMRISVRGCEIVTTNLEFRLLYYLVHNQARVFTRDKLLDAVWGTKYVDLRSVDACVRRLRRKIELDPSRPAYLRTVRGAGYCLQMDAS
jgi:DNA-binding response OmpR family regulator